MRITELCGSYAAVLYGELYGVIRELYVSYTEGYPYNSEGARPQDTYLEGFLTQSLSKNSYPCYAHLACLQFRVIRSYAFFFLLVFFR